MSRLFLLAAAAGLALPAALPAAPLRADRNPSLSAIHQPVVQRTDYVLDVAAPGDRLDGYGAGRLQGWFDSIGLGYGDVVSVDGQGYGSARDDVAALAAGYGLLLSDGAPITAGAVAPGTIRIVVTRASASVPGCPQWSTRHQLGASISTDSNYGCATSSNLAAMIADANDLVLGREGAGGDPASAAKATKAIKAYRDRAGSGATGTVRPERVGEQK